MADSKDKTTPAAKDSKVFDVAKPGKTTPSTTSRPIIVTNHQLLQDPMVVDEQTSTDTPGEPAQPTTGKVLTGKLKIEPISKPEDLKPAEDPEPEAATDPEPDTDDTIEDQDDAVGRDTIKKASSDEQELIDKKAAEHQANLDKVALAKTYYLPINQVERRRSKHIAAAGILLIILLGVAWGDVALDAGLVSIPGLKAPTHFFSK